MDWKEVLVEEVEVYEYHDSLAWAAEEAAAYYH